jgi:ssDNA-binding replication factor A large subunit
MSESKALNKPKFVKVKDLDSLGSGYNVYVKVVSAEPRTIETKDGINIPMVDCIVAD